MQTPYIMHIDTRLQMFKVEYSYWEQHHRVRGDYKVLDMLISSMQALYTTASMIASYVLWMKRNCIAFHRVFFLSFFFPWFQNYETCKIAIAPAHHQHNSPYLSITDNEKNRTEYEQCMPNHSDIFNYR